MNILFVHNYPMTFVQQDLACLRLVHQVTELRLSSRRIDLAHVWRMVAAHDLVFGWFASWHTLAPMLFAKVLGKPSTLVIGGYDLANQPEIGYGHQRGGVKKWISRATMRLAGTLMTNSRYSEKEAHQNARLRRRSIHVSYHGIPDPFGELPSESRESIVITVGNVDRPNMQRKGLEPFVRAAKHLPGVRFILIGGWKDSAIDDLRKMATPNVEFAGRVDDPTLADYYGRASVYVQASSHEGFGMAVAEAMLGGCIPVLTRAGALPEVAAECGVYCDSVESGDLAKAISIALQKSPIHRLEARHRILTKFPLSARRSDLLEIVSQAAGNLTDAITDLTESGVA